ncbi:threonine dehydratase [Sphingomonas sp. QA11]|uniref:threonine dehydratase n=1 Tax=Sphingomonas sp. QA11 TaxID=2950605 RepID=UPI00234B2AE8|nr:threonine dehydratase [Sphingomonas sp. QA11]WCM27392.1 threonine dehydratase [Sphingomonas sp. QA11]
MKFDWAEIDNALEVVRRTVPPTPAYFWPQLRRKTGVELVLKHENHTPTGSFKARGGLVYVDALRQSLEIGGLVTATRGNHGQSIAMGASAAGIETLIVVPRGNSIEKNRAMEAFGGTLLVAGDDFDDARRIAAEEAAERGWTLVPSFHRDIARGVATYALELFQGIGELDAVFVPVGMGSGICALIGMRDLLGLKTKIIGVVADKAPAFALSYAGRSVRLAAATTFADGLACREPHEEALAAVIAGAEDVVRVTEWEIAEAIRDIYEMTHNLAEGAGAAAYAAVFKHRSAYRGKRVAAILTGGNIDRRAMATVLSGATPQPGAQTMSLEPIA